MFIGRSLLSPYQAFWCVRENRINWRRAPPKIFRLFVDQQSADSGLTDDQQSVDERATVGRQTIDSRRTVFQNWTVDRRSVNCRWTWRLSFGNLVANVSTFWNDFKTMPFLNFKSSKRLGIVFRAFHNNVSLVCRQVSLLCKVTVCICRIPRYFLTVKRIRWLFTDWFCMIVSKHIQSILKGITINHCLPVW